MIRVIKDWVIDADKIGYQVGKIKTRYNKKLGKDEEYISNAKYPFDIKHAVQIIYEAEKKDIVMRGNMSLTEAIEKIAALEKDFTDILNKVLKEKI